MMDLSPRLSSRWRKCPSTPQKYREDEKRSFEDARSAEKWAATLAKEKDATVQKMKVTLQRQEATEKERDAAKSEASSAVEVFKKTTEFARIAENHCLAKLIKIYGDLVTQIKEVQSKLPVDQVKGLQVFLAW